MLNGMTREPWRKYRPFPQIDLPDRQWPTRTITSAPTWVSVDLRDGNQALVEPMGVAEKLELFRLLVDIGFKEIEIGFPAASQVEYDFVRMLIEHNMIPSDVWVQVLTQAREHLIRRTFESLKGVERAIVHVYNSTSEVQRRVVFRKGRDEIADLAIQGTKLVKQLLPELPGSQIRYEYSPESFTATELDFALRVCEDVMDAWEPTAEDPIVLNLPSTVELASPNVYADQIEWMSKHLSEREKAIISVHTHNDRGTGVASAELAMMAGAQRVEGTLFGYGERTGNVDLVTLALNMYSQGVDPKLNLSDLEHICEVVTRCTDNPIHPRHPYAGELVFTAFSGSHQDAISKGMAVWAADPSQIWDVPYIPIDPKDLSRDYTTIIRVNSQSGKGGVAHILREEAGFVLPRAMQPEFGGIIQRITEKTGKEITADEIVECFRREYLDLKVPYELVHFMTDTVDDGVKCSASIRKGEEIVVVSGVGTGPIDAFVKALQEWAPVEVIAFSEHSLGHEASAVAAAYVEVSVGPDVFWGAGIDSNATTASLKAVLCAVNRASGARK